MAGSEQVLARLAKDTKFQASVLADATSALAEYDLTDAERKRVLDEAEMMQAAVQTNPLEPSEADTGQADAAGAKG